MIPVCIAATRNLVWVLPEEDICVAQKLASLGPSVAPAWSLFGFGAGSGVAGTHLWRGLEMSFWDAGGIASSQVGRKSAKSDLFMNGKLWWASMWKCGFLVGKSNIQGWFFEICIWRALRVRHPKWPLPKDFYNALKICVHPKIFFKIENSHYGQWKKVIFKVAVKSC